MKSVALRCAFVVALASVSVIAFCQGQIKHYQIPTTSMGQPTQQGLSVYLPEGYESSGRSYPTLYLVHGAFGDDTYFLDGDEASLHFNLILERAVREGRGRPLIAVCPNVNGIGPKLEYLRDTVIPFIDATFRTIPNRDSRAIAGHSQGGNDAVQLAFSQPGLFSVVGGFASYQVEFLIPKLGRIRESFDQEAYPIRFWLYAGRHDPATIQANRDFSKALEEKGWPAKYAEDDGDHFSNIPQQMTEFLAYLSQSLKW